MRRHPSVPAAPALRRRRRESALRISPLQPGDVDACAHIVAGDPLWQRYGLTFARARATILRARPAWRARDEKGGTFAVARRGDDVLGFVWFREEGTFHHSGYVRLIGVAPHARGAGVGRRLLAYAEERILRSGPNVFLLVSDFNRRAQAFYRRQGYTRIGVVPDYVAPGITEYLFRKTRGPVAQARGGERARMRGHTRA